MERMAWTDERLDDLTRRMDAGFERVDADMRELRAEVRAQGVELRGEIGGLRITLLRVGGVMVASLVGIIAAVLAGG